MKAEIKFIAEENDRRPTYEELGLILFEISDMIHKGYESGKRKNFEWKFSMEV